MELYPGVHQIASLFGGRNLYQYLFVGERMTVLLDSGVADTPEQVIFPYMEQIGLRPQQLTLAITMHADLDHQGGNAALRAASRHTLLACHRDDRKLIESPEALYCLRYDHLHADCGVAAPEEMMPHAGRPTAIDVLFSGGETLRLGPDWELQVWHVPGHSDGHLTLYDPKHRAAFSSDAVQGRGNFNADGSMAFGPTYYAVDAYLNTIQFLESMPIEHLYSGHWANAHGTEVADFLRVSRIFVERMEELLPVCLDRHPGGATLAELIAGLAPRMGDWPAPANWLFMWAVYGHLVRQEQRQKVARVAGAHPIRWKRA